MTQTKVVETNRCRDDARCAMRSGSLPGNALRVQESVVNSNAFEVEHGGPQLCQFRLEFASRSDKRRCQAGRSRPGTGRLLVSNFPFAVLGSSGTTINEAGII